jgi:WD40 repeat protein
MLVLFDMYLLSGHTFGVRSVALSADGSKVVSGSNDKTVKIWSADSGEVLQTLSGDIVMTHIYVSYVI